MSTRALTRSEVETAIERRGAEVYAGFLRPHLRPDMVVLDCGCGKATVALGLAEAVRMVASSASISIKAA